MNLSALFCLLIIAKSSNKQSITYYTLLKTFFSNVLMVLFQKICIRYNFYWLHNILNPRDNIFLGYFGINKSFFHDCPWHMCAYIYICLCVFVFMYMCLCMYMLYMIYRIVIICRFHHSQCSILRDFTKS